MELRKLEKILWKATITMGLAGFVATSVGVAASFTGNTKMENKISNLFKYALRPVTYVVVPSFMAIFTIRYRKEDREYKKQSQNSYSQIM